MWMQERLLRLCVGPNISITPCKRIWEHHSSLICIHSNLKLQFLWAEDLDSIIRIIFYVCFIEYYLEDVIQMLSFVPPLPEKKKKKDETEDDEEVR